MARAHDMQIPVDLLGIHQSFDTKDDAVRWLLEQGAALRIPSLPKSADHIETFSARRTSPR